MSSRSLIRVALPLPIDRAFTYSIDGSAPPPPGSRVLVPFRRREMIGWVIGSEDETVANVRPVLSVLDELPSAPPDLLSLVEWMADYYVAPLGLALKAALPAVLSDASKDYISPVVGSPSGRTQREQQLLGWLEERRSPQRVATARRVLQMGSLWPEIRSLTERGAIRHETVPPRDPPVRTQRVVEIVRALPDLREREDVFGRAGKQREAYQVIEAAGGRMELKHLGGLHGFSRSVVAGLEGKGLVAVVDEERFRDPFEDRSVPEPPNHTLTVDQDRCVAALVAALDEESPAPFLLHGVTGSGKTLVYIELLRKALERGRTAVVLVPEISLTPQTVARFRAHFGDRVAVLHSALSDGERYDAWRRLRSGDRRIAVGARSALFAPLPDLGVIVVDEEHDGSYKQSDVPRYQARDLSVVRAAASGAVCVLGSATPSLESWTNAEHGKFRLLSLPERVGGGSLPPVQLIDLREERKSSQEEKGSHRPAGSGVLSSPLIEAINERLHRGEQIILLLNRRGYSSFVQCRECGDVRQCAHCSVSLTYHRVPGRLVCHHCRHEEPAPERCPQCGSRDLSFRGLGTEQVERVVAETFGQARIARMDVDTTSGKWSHHEILGRVERGEVDILLGTQMIAKGLDFPRVTLVGVINADIGIHLPDFRATERTFQLLSQVAGRTGRGTLGGRVLVQTSMPGHYAVRAAVDHDFESFAERELAERARPRYPPHVRLANVVVSSPDAELAANVAMGGANWVRGWIRRADSDVDMVGPAPSPIEKLHGRWRWHFLLRSPSAGRLGAACRAFIGGFRPRAKDVRIALDRDPNQLL